MSDGEPIPGRAPVPARPSAQAGEPRMDIRPVDRILQDPHAAAHLATARKILPHEYPPLHPQGSGVPARTPDGSPLSEGWVQGTMTPSGEVMAKVLHDTLPSMPRPLVGEAQAAIIRTDRLAVYSSVREKEKAGGLLRRSKGEEPVKTSVLNRDVAKPLRESGNPVDTLVAEIGVAAAKRSAVETENAIAALAYIMQTADPKLQAEIKVDLQGFLTHPHSISPSAEALAISDEVNRRVMDALQAHNIVVPFDGSTMLNPDLAGDPEKLWRERAIAQYDLNQALGPLRDQSPKTQRYGAEAVVTLILNGAYPAISRESVIRSLPSIGLGTNEHASHLFGRDASVFDNVDGSWISLEYSDAVKAVHAGEAAAKREAEREAAAKREADVESLKKARAELELLGPEVDTLRAVGRMLQTSEWRSRFFIAEADKPESFTYILDGVIASDIKQRGDDQSVRRPFFDTVVNTNFDTTREQFAALASAEHDSPLASTLATRFNELDPEQAKDFALTRVSNEGNETWAPIVARYASENPEASRLLMDLATSYHGAADTVVAQYLVEHTDRLGVLTPEVMADAIFRVVSDPAIQESEKHQFVAGLFSEQEGGLNIHEERAEKFREVFAQTVGYLFNNESGERRPREDIRPTVEFLDSLPQRDGRDKLHELYNLITVPEDVAAFQAAVKEYADANPQVAAEFLEGSIAQRPHFVRDFMVRATKADETKSGLVNVVSSVVSGHMAEAQRAIAEVFANTTADSNGVRANQPILDLILTNRDEAQKAFQELIAANPEESARVTEELMTHTPDVAVKVLSEHPLNSELAEAFINALHTGHPAETTALLSGLLERSEYRGLIPKIIASIQDAGNPEQQKAIFNAINTLTADKGDLVTESIAVLARQDKSIAKRVFASLSQEEQERLRTYAGSVLERLGIVEPTAIRDEVRKPTTHEAVTRVKRSLK